MKNMLKNITLFTIILCFYIYLIKFNAIISNQIISTYNIWLTKIFPILFPSFILSDIITNSNIPYYFKKITKIDYIYFFSIFFGSPTNAYILSNYNDDITKHLVVTNYPSLLFAYSFIKSILNFHKALLIIIANIIANIILILMLHPKNLNIYYKKFNLDISNIINKSMITNISILGTIIFYSIIPVHLIKIKPIKYFLISLLEISNSYTFLSSSIIPEYIKSILVIFTTSSTGLCIQTQIYNIAKNNFVPKKYLEYKILHILLHLSIYQILLFFK